MPSQVMNFFSFAIIDFIIKEFGYCVILVCKLIEEAEQPDGDLVGFAFVGSVARIEDVGVVADSVSAARVYNAEPQFVVELPKFKPQSISERRMAVLWLRFLTEMNAGTDSVPKEFLENPYLREAVRLLETSSYNESQLYNYEKFWDAVASERVMVTDAMRKGKMEGLEEGKKQGLEEGKIQGARENAISIARNLKRLGLPDNEIAQATGLPIEEVEKVGGELI